MYWWGNWLSSSPTGSSLISFSKLPTHIPNVHKMALSLQAQPYNERRKTSWVTSFAQRARVRLVPRPRSIPLHTGVSSVLSHKRHHMRIFSAPLFPWYIRTFKGYRDIYARVCDGFGWCNENLITWQDRTHLGIDKREGVYLLSHFFQNSLKPKNLENKGREKGKNPSSLNLQCQDMCHDLKSQNLKVQSGTTGHGSFKPQLVSCPRCSSESDGVILIYTWICDLIRHCHGEGHMIACT